MFDMTVRHLTRLRRCSCINVRRSQSLSECGFGRLKFVQAPAGAAGDFGREAEKDETHFAPLDGVWKQDGILWGDGSKWTVIDSRDLLPTQPTQEEQENARLLGSP